MNTHAVPPLEQNPSDATGRQVGNILRQLHTAFLECKCTYSATSNNMKLVHYTGRDDGWAVTFGTTQPRPLLAVPNVT